MNHATTAQQLIVPIALSGVDTTHSNIGPETPFFRDMTSLIGHLEPHASQFLLGTNTQFHLLNKRQRVSISCNDYQISGFPRAENPSYCRYSLIR